MDGLVIVYATGGVVVSNLEEKNLELRIFEISGLIQRYAHKFFFKSQSNPMSHISNSFTCLGKQTQFAKSKAEYAKTDAGRQKRERRFLAICYKNKGLPNQRYYTEQYKGDKSNGENLYDATEKVLNF